MADTKKEKTFSDLAVDQHHRSGRSVFNPRSGEDMSGHNLWVGAAVPEASHISEQSPTAEHHTEFTALHSDLLSRHENALVGTHHDHESGLHHTEILFATPSKHVAVAAAQHFGAKKVHHLGTGETVNTGATQEYISHPVDARFHSIREISPKKETYHGVHFSDTKLETIEGARRGAPNAKGEFTGAEAHRLRLGTQTGLGKDAPPGFYTHDKGTMPDIAVASRKHAHEVRGHYALATTDHPDFVRAHALAVHHALKNGADQKTAAGLGANAGEHALRDSGFDGYSNPARPGTKFIFGDHQVEQKEKVK